MSEFVTASESRTVTAHGIFNNISEHREIEVEEYEHYDASKCYHNVPN